MRHDHCTAHGFSHFDSLAPFYEAFIKPQSPQELLTLAALPVEGALLDVGGGTGRVTQFLRDMATSLIVVDPSWQMLKEAYKKGGLHPICSHAEKLPFPDSSFARIIMVDALHHVCNQRQTAQELWRVLQPGGRIVIEEPDVRTLTVRMIALAEKLALMRSHFLIPPQIARLFPYPDARVHIETKRSIAWIVVEKF
jgi:ubiquinone/menaquinone biosynthesis C-methylase UbiE